MMREQLTLPDAVWRTVNHAWAGFFAALGVINLYVAFNYTIEFWVNFKLFGTTGLMLVFVIAQSLLLSKYVEEKDAK
jgi:intracellular septation protein